MKSYYIPFILGILFLFAINSRSFAQVVRVPESRELEKELKHHELKNLEHLEDLKHELDHLHDIDISVELEESLKDLQHELHHLEDFELSDLEIDLSGLAASLEDMEFSLEHIEIPEIPPIDVHIPHIPNVRIPYIPQIHIEIPHIDFSGSGCSQHSGRSALHVFKNLSDDEELRVLALQNISLQDENKAIAAFQKVIKEESNPALRYEAVRQLGRFLNDDKVVPLLCEVAKSDKNIEVRKKAIYLLGESGDERAVKVLRKLIEK